MKTLFLLIITAYTVGALAAPTKNLDELFKNKTKIENPFELRDPFKAPTPSRNSGNSPGQGGGGKGQYTNIVETRSDQLNLNDIRVTGVLIGKERRAIIATEGNKQVMIVKEGMKLGSDGVELKAILPGGIILVEKIINVYGQEEYLETVIPISK